MTNEQIIKAAQSKLIAEGKIKSDEEIHTYHQWKKLGYQVFRGEKAVTALDIWRFFQSNADEKEEREEEEKEKKKEGRMQMQKAYFFSTSQVFSLELN